MQCLNFPSHVYLILDGFVPTNLEWLVDENNKQILLDLYNKDYNLAVEYRGTRHHIFVKNFHKTKENAENFIKNIKLKDKLCKENKLDLITIPYSTNIADVCGFIYRELVKLGYEVTEDKVKSFDMKDYKNIITNTCKLVTLVESKGYKLINGYALSN